MAIVYSIIDSGNTTVEAVATAAGVGTATGLSVSPIEGVATAAGVGSAGSVGESVPAPDDHHVALPRPAPSETTCECE